jgi:hypothetical protein
MVGLCRDLADLELLDLSRIEPPQGLVRDLQEDTGSIVILHEGLMNGALETTHIILPRVMVIMVVTAVANIDNGPPKDSMGTLLIAVNFLPSNISSGSNTT